MTLTGEDESEIRNLLARYCVLLDQDDVDGWVQLFTPDAEYVVYGRTFVGHDGLRKMLSGAPGGLHLGGPPAVDVMDAGRARAQQNLLFIDRVSGEQRSALYDDVLVHTAQGWRIASRRCRFHTASGLDDRPD